MRYIDHCIKLYETLIDSDSEKYFSTGSVNPLNVIELLLKKLTYDQMKRQYSVEIEEIIDDHLSKLKIDRKSIEEYKKMSYYFESVGQFVLTMIFWIKYNNFDFSNDELLKLSEAQFLGTIGYKLNDAYTDEGILGMESRVLGNYFINIYEKILLDIYNEKDTFNVINKNVRIFTEVEYLEKKNLWKKCPFSWDEPEKIGCKTSPVYSLFEIILKKAGKEKKEIEALLEGLLYFAAALQMLDDFTDASNDLKNGIETLVMKGFFEKYGNIKNVSDDLIQSFLNEEKILRFYNTTQMLFEKGRKIFTKYEDDILLLTVEFQNYIFNSILAKHIKI